MALTLLGFHAARERHIVFAYIMVAWTIGSIVILALAQLVLSKRESKPGPKWDREEQILGTLGPIAGELVAGRMTRAEADAEVQRSESLTPGVVKFWQELSEKERQDLGEDMLLLCEDPQFISRVTAHLDPLTEALDRKK